MLFFYSRRVQFILLLCWSVGMVVMYAAIIGSDPHFFYRADISQASTAKPSVAQLPVTDNPPPPPPATVKTNADPTRNKAGALRITTQTEGCTTALVLDFDYVPAESNGFIPDKTYAYFIDSPPTFVLSLGEHWIMDIGQKKYPVDLPQVDGVTIILSQSNHLRILTHTRTTAQARSAKVKIIPTPAGLQAQIHFSK